MIMIAGPIKTVLLNPCSIGPSGPPDKSTMVKANNVSAVSAVSASLARLSTVIGAMVEFSNCVEKSTKKTISLPQNRQHVNIYPSSNNYVKTVYVEILDPFLRAKPSKSNVTLY